jgi:hypothetical protein
MSVDPAATEELHATSGGSLLAVGGPVTSFGQSLAMVVGAGVLLGGFLAGVLTKILGWSRPRREEAIANSGYIGGLVMIATLALEMIFG